MLFRVGLCQGKGSGSLRAESNRRVKRSSLLISPESFEPIRRECDVSRRVLDVLVPEIRLERARIMAVVSELVKMFLPEGVLHGKHEERRRETSDP
jgi:hypothetical protein